MGTRRGKCIRKPFSDGERARLMGKGRGTSVPQIMELRSSRFLLALPYRTIRPHILLDRTPPLMLNLPIWPRIEGGNSPIICGIGIGRIPTIFVRFSRCLFVADVRPRFERAIWVIIPGSREMSATSRSCRFSRNEGTASENAASSSANSRNSRARSGSPTIRRYPRVSVMELPLRKVTANSSASLAL